jgi:competence protein ComEA
LLSNSTAFRVDLNHADVSKLMLLPGVGESMARRIDEHRRRYGPFRDVEELTLVSGIGPATLERLRPFVYAEAAALPEEDGDEPRAEMQPVARPVSPLRKSAAKSKPASAKLSNASERIDLNRASAEQLQRLPGIGPAMAARIVAAREVKPFGTLEDLRRVPGIGAKTLERLRPNLSIGNGDRDEAPDEK